MTLLASLIGLYGLIAGSVALRRREFGLRMALGARASQVSGSVMGEGLRLSLFGAVPGLAVALFAAPQVARRVADDVPGSILPIIGLALVFSLVAVFACWLPARRAARIEPIEALRDS